MKIAVVTLWFGPTPSWLPEFQERVRANPIITWIPIGSEPFCQVPLTLQEFNEFASQRLRLKVAKANPMGTCDLRPAFGHIFADLFAPYDFWGWCDLDVVWGCLADLLTPERLATSDIISGSHRIIEGPFTVLRNTPAVNQQYQHASPDVFELGSYQQFDEIGFTEIVKTHGLRMTYSPSIPGTDNHNFPCFLIDGKLYVADQKDSTVLREIFLYHFNLHKRWPL